MEDKKPEEKKKSEVYAEQAEQAFNELQPDLEEMKKKYEAVKEELVNMGKFAAKLFNFAKAKVSQKGMEAFEAVEAQYEEAKREVDNRFSDFKSVGSTSKLQSAKIRSAREVLNEKSEKFTEKQTDRSESSVLSGAAKLNRGFNQKFSLFGEKAAKAAKIPHTFAARVAALKGDREGMVDSLIAADTKEQDVMKKVKDAIEKTEKGIQKRITSYNRVERRTARQDTTIETKTNDTLDRIDDFIAAQENNGSKRGVIANIMGVNHGIRAYTGNIEAQLARIGYDALAKGSAIIGKDKMAQELSQKGGKVSRGIMDRVSKHNTKEQKDFSDRMATHDSIERATDAKVESLDKKAEQVNAKTDNWKTNHESKGFMSDGIRAVTGVIIQSITGATKLYAKGDMRLTEVAAKTAAFLGFRKEAQQMVQEAKSRSTENMKGAEKVNKAVRSGADATMKFKDRRKAEVINLGNTIGKGVKAGIEYVGDGIDKGVEAIDKGIEAGIDFVETGIETGTKFVKDTARDVKADAQLVANRVSERYNKGKAGFFTTLKNGPAKLFSNLAKSFEQSIDNQIINSNEKAIAASKNASRIEGSKMSNEPKETNKDDGSR